jgi:DNA-binding XRE family transcriptional regulator
MINVDTLLVKYRNNNRISQEELANLLRVRRSTLADWERRKTKPNLDNVCKICLLLKLDLRNLENN